MIDADSELGDESGPLAFSGTGVLQAAMSDVNLAATRAIVTPDDPSLAAIIDSHGNDVTVFGPISGAGGLTAIETTNSGGTLKLSSANNTFTGVTTVGGAYETFILGDPAAPGQHLRHQRAGQLELRR